jgi:hypothetical protein
MRHCVFIFCNYNTGHRNPIKTIRYAIAEQDPSYRVPLRLQEGDASVCRFRIRGCRASGMPIIVPAHKILEVIHQPELAAMRKESDKKMAKMSASAGS